ncbi:hypothetical protein DP49_5893 [Burkholderia pseudomallei]|nr:hypothetical protein DP49_5893 [Burkholderia pseudomallei]
MTQLVQIARGTVFSSDMLGVAWVRKHYGDYGSAEQSGNAPSQWVASQDHNGKGPRHSRSPVGPNVVAVDHRGELRCRCRKNLGPPPSATYQRCITPTRGRRTLVALLGF